MDFNVNVKITAPEICEALKELALAYAGRTTATATEAAKNLAEATMGALEKVTAPAETAPEAPEKPVQPVPAAPAPAPAPETQPAPTTPAEPAPVASVAAPSITLDQIKAAGAGLAAHGKTLQLMELMKKYGVQSIPELQPEQFEAMAADLRAMGAKL